MLSKFIKLVKAQARKKPARIVFPETSDNRVLEAVSKIAAEKTAIPVLLGDKTKLKISASKFEIIDIKKDSRRREHFAEELFSLRKEKGLTLKEAKELVKKPNYFGVMMVKLGEADGMVSGSVSPTAEVLHPALQIIKTKEKFHKVSGFFFMVIEKRLMLFADCAVNVSPAPNELAEIAIDTADTACRFGIKPRIAMLSFSTNGSTDHPNAKRIKEAAEMVRYMRPDLVCEGEMQVDAALAPEVCKLKFPKSRVLGDANVLIFPNLEAANISYKLVERLGHAQALGPILQGLQKPINDLSRSCSADDIVNIAAITSVETQDATINVNSCR